MTIEAMKQALEALEAAHPKPYNESVISHVEAITALRTAIAEAEKQEPVAEVVEDDFSKQVVGIGRWLKLQNGTKLYTTPPAAQRQWVGLTEKEIADIWDEQFFHITDMSLAIDFVRDIEAAHGIGEKK